MVSSLIMTPAAEFGKPHFRGVLHSDQLCILKNSFANSSALVELRVSLPDGSEHCQGAEHGVLEQGNPHKLLRALEVRR